MRNRLLSAMAGVAFYTLLTVAIVFDGAQVWREVRRG